MRQTKTLLALLGCALLAGCANQHYLNNSSQILLEYQQHPTNHNLIELSKSYAAAINNNRAMGVVEPGLFADYAVTLVKLGHRAEANKMFNNEVKTYPSSEKYVRQLKLHLLPEFVTDTLGGDVDIDFVSMIAADSASNVAETAPSEPVKLTKEEREELKMDREAEREEMKRAREHEREQREIAKQALEKQKKQLKKQEEKQKKQMRKQKEKERKALQKQREQEREAMREQREQEREALQKQREEQREALQKQREEEREALQRQREEARAEQQRQREQERAKGEE